ncbi:unnamed protein product [Protopolystoma xenopodis]|uniref:Exportin-1/Importin-beta-like domain-containing protein n=1 Tax=Protopolystoma xenopodis TaxID=117903 RepID=A0A3S5AY81_9PLAT|nr:unnamed protein product [Protopolystoma xenopodis]
MPAIFTSRSQRDSNLGCESDRPWSDLQWGLCFWDDVIEFAGPQAWHLRDFYLPRLAQALTHPEPPVRQAAFYGVGMAAQHGCPEWDTVLPEFTLTLIKCIGALNSRDSQNNFSTENAICAVTKIMKYRPHCLPSSLGGLDQLIPNWLTWLPVWEDTSETYGVFDYLCDLVQANCPALLGPDNANLPRVVHAIAHCLASKGMSPEGPQESHGMAVSTADHQQTDAVGSDGKSDDPASPDSRHPARAYFRCLHILRQVQASCINLSEFLHCIALNKP